MSQPEQTAQSVQADDFLVTTDVNPDGTFSTRTIKVQDVPTELLYSFVELGNTRALDELVMRLAHEIEPPGGAQ
jgi:hypothetical protein